MKKKHGEGKIHPSNEVKPTPTTITKLKDHLGNTIFPQRLFVQNCT